MELVHQVRYSLPRSRLCAAHLPTLSSVGCLGSAADEVVEPVAEPLDAAEGVVAELAAFGFGKVGEKGANAGVERHYAITAWGLNVALRRVRDNEPVEAAFLYQSAFFVLLLGWLRPSAAVRAWCDRRRAPSRRRPVCSRTAWGSSGCGSRVGRMSSSALWPCVWLELEFQVEGLDVGHGAAGVSDCGALHLVGNRIPFGM